VVERLRAAWSPKQIAGHVRRSRSDTPSICHETIYQYVYGLKGDALACGETCPVRADHAVGVTLETAWASHCARQYDCAKAA
jgi:IS30 family transposase